MSAALGAAFWPFLLLAIASVRGSADEFQCACGHDARRHVRAARAALNAGDAAAAADAAAAYGAVACRMLSAACGGRMEPTARWLWLLDLYANDARRPSDGGGDGDGGGGKTAPGRRLRDAVDLVRDELDRYMRTCEARGLAEFARHWSRPEFERYLSERSTAARAERDAGAGGGGARRAVPDETGFEPRRLYLDDVAAGGGAALAAVVMPRDVGVDWADAADRLAGAHRAARRAGVHGTRELVLFQKGFVSAVAATGMAHVLVHIARCREYWLGGGGGGGEGEGRARDAGDGSYVGEYERTWMSVGGLLEKFSAYLDLRGARGPLRPLFDVAANPARDGDGFRAAELAVRAQIADAGAGLFGPAATASPTAVVETGGGAPPRSLALMDLIALVDSNIGAAEKYLAAVQASLPGVDFRIVNEFMRSTHAWLT